MNKFADAVIAIAPMDGRKSRNRFFRNVDRWSNRLFLKGLITLQQRQEQRKRIADAYVAPLM